MTTVARETVEEMPEPGSLVVARVPLAEGFALPELGIRVFTDAEVFGFRKPRHPDRPRRRVHIGSFLSDLKPGDHVVHEDHGIARFERFVTREIAGVVREYLELRFAGTDVVSLPTERVDKVTRYVGGTPPGLSTLGGILDDHSLAPQLFDRFAFSLRVGGYVLVETPGRQGGNYLDLSPAGQLRSALEGAFDFQFSSGWNSDHQGHRRGDSPSRTLADSDQNSTRPQETVKQALHIIGGLDLAHQITHPS